MIIEHSFIIQQGKASERQLSIEDDSIVEDLKKLTNIIHKNGSKAVMQINHAGSAASKYVTGYEAVGPSSIVNPRKGDMPRELNKKEINSIIKKNMDAALRVKEADSAEKLLSEEKADLIGVGRAIYKDSRWAEKAVKSLI
ncbi:hypothetical protein [Clostridium gasigenes]|uniref:oxidoreductase n=1 Tax=Clostridium gasigenes TaxID=94869 RepID=UPI003395FD47